jgi:hypothetical protein
MEEADAEAVTVGTAFTTIVLETETEQPLLLVPVTE